MIIPAFLVALALAQLDPNQPVATQPVATQPVATQPSATQPPATQPSAPGAEAPAAAPPDAAAPASKTPASTDDSDVPKGAPTDDYGLVAWCRGALTGHMALYPLVKPEMKSIERPGEVSGDEKSDEAQMQAGRDYLALYARAMRAAEKADPKRVERGLAIRSQGEGIWTEAKTAEPRTRMWSWLMWDLPGQCEVSAKRLVGPSTSAHTEPALRAPQ